jgi:gluconate kinase
MVLWNTTESRGEKESEARKQVFIKMEAYEKKLDGIKIPSSDPSVILLPVKRWIEEIRSEMEKQPKTVVQEKDFRYYQTGPLNCTSLFLKAL